MKQQFLKTILLLLVTISFTNCDKEDDNQIPSNDIQQIKNKFSLDNFEDINFKNSLSIDWSDFQKQENLDNKSLFYEFNTILSSNNFVENGKQKRYFEYKLLANKDELGFWNLQLIKFLTQDENSLNGISYFSTNNFSGTLSQFNLKGENLSIKGYENGILISEFNSKESNTNNTFSKQENSEIACSHCYVLLTTEHYTDWYKGGSGGIYTYTHSVLDYVSHEYEYVGGEDTGGTIEEFKFHSHNSTEFGGGNNHGNEILLKEDGLHFNSLREFKDFINDFDFEININVENNQDGTHTSTFKVKFNYLATINININQKLKNTTTNQDYKLNNLNTIYSGFTLGTSWTQSSYDYTIFNNTAIIDLYGSLNYNIFIEDIGTVFTDALHYQMIVDIETGQQISITKQP